MPMTPPVSGIVDDPADRRSHWHCSHSCHPPHGACEDRAPSPALLAALWAERTEQLAVVALALVLEGRGGHVGGGHTNDVRPKCGDGCARRCGRRDHGQELLSLDRDLRGKLGEQHQVRHSGANKEVSSNRWWGGWRVPW